MRLRFVSGLLQARQSLIKGFFFEYGIGAL